MKRLMTLTTAILSLTLFGAKEAVWEGTATSSWDADTSWRNGIKPEAGDWIWVVAGKTLPVSDANMPLFKTLQSVKVPSNSTVIFNLANDHELETTVFSSTGDSGSGTAIKEGEGNLFFKAATAKPFDGLSKLVLNGGSIQTLPQSATLSFPLTEVNKPALLVLGGNSGFSGLIGDGSVTNTMADAQLYFNGGTDENPHVFRGKLLAGCHLTPSYYSTSCCRQYFEGEDTDAALDIRNYGVVGVKHIGTQATGGSIGRSDFSFRGGPRPTLRYLGTGETTDKSFIFYNVCPIAYLDAGEQGGVTFTGEWRISAHTNWKPNYRFNTIVLEGENHVNPCIIKAGMYDSLERASTYWRKEGTGIWRFTEHGKGHMGVMDVRRGTLEFTTIAQKGVLSALGSSEFTCADVSGLPDRSTAPRVDYAFVVGDGETAASDAYVATMKYMGTAAATCTTRPLRVRGAGGLESTTAPLTFADVAPMGAGDHTFVLGGAAEGNVISSVTNGPDGTLSVIKRGSGDWTLQDDINVKSITVEEGKLAVGRPKYQYYKWMITSNNGGAGGEWIGAFNGFAVMNAAGEMQNLTLGKSGMANKNGQPWTLEPGELCYNKYFGSTGGRYPSKSFDWNPETSTFAGADASIDVTIHNDQPDTWPVVYFRVSEGAEPIAKFDVLASGNAARNVAGWELSGSVDGRNWDVLHYLNPTNVTVPAGNKWYSSGTTERTGFAIATGPAQAVNVAAVSVAEGATLEVSEVAGVTVNELSYDALKGAGAVKGIAFAAEGVIQVANKGGKLLSSFDVPLDLTGCSDTANLANWELKMDGNTVPAERYELTVTASGIHVEAKIPGLSIIFR